MKTTLLSLLLLIASVNVSLAQEEISVAKDPGNDQAQSLTPINLSNRGLGGAGYKWTLYTAAVGGGFGVMPNAFEIWEYPPSTMNPNWSIQRLSINRSNGHPPAVMIDQNGGLALGGYIDAGNALLAVNGNVGIGTTDTKGYRLAVNGNVHAKQITIDLDQWPDYVFNRDYRLMSLTELNAFIKENNHLPEMPSEKEVAEKGLNLGDMNKLLTKKIEELTLYLIEKDKEIKEQRIKINDQDNRLQKIEAALNKK